MNAALLTMTLTRWALADVVGDRHVDAALRQLAAVWAYLAPMLFPIRSTVTVERWTTCDMYTAAAKVTEIMVVEDRIGDYPVAIYGSIVAVPVVDDPVILPLDEPVYVRRGRKYQLADYVAADEAMYAKRGRKYVVVSHPLCVA